MDADPWDLDELASESARHHQEFGSMVKVEPKDASEVNEDDVKCLLKVKDELFDQMDEAESKQWQHLNATHGKGGQWQNWAQSANWAQSESWKDWEEDSRGPWRRHAETVDKKLWIKTKHRFVDWNAPSRPHRHLQAQWYSAKMISMLC